MLELLKTILCLSLGLCNVNLPLHVPEQNTEKRNPDSYQYLKSVEQRGGIGQAAELLIGGVIFGNVAVGSGAQEHFLNAARERVAQVLHRVHHHAAVDRRVYKDQICLFVGRISPNASENPSGGSCGTF